MDRNPNLKPFVPGQSGNPSGKRKGAVSITAAIRRQLADGDDAESIATALIRGARAGDIRHIVEILNRIDGKVPDKLIAAAAAALKPQVADAVIAAGLDADESDGDPGPGEECETGDG